MSLDLVVDPRCPRMARARDLDLRLHRLYAVYNVSLVGKHLPQLFDHGLRDIQGKFLGSVSDDLLYKD